VSCSIEGRLLETILKAEQDAAPAAAARNRRAGRPRPVVRRHYDRLPLMAGRWSDDGQRKPPWTCGFTPAGCAPRKHGAGDRKAADGAPRGACVLPDARRAQSADLAGAPRGAPSPSMFFEGSKDGPARGLDKEYGRWRLSGANRASPARAALAGLSEK